MHHYYNPSGGMTSNRHWTLGVKWIMIANLAVFGIQVLFSLLPEQWSLQDFLLYYFALSPEKVVKKFWLWQLISSAFLHDLSGALPWHLFFNLLALYFFGHMVERHYGTKRFIVFYLACAIFASLVYTVFHYILGTRSIAIGASGAIMGILVIGACLEPNLTVYFQFLFPIRLRTLVWVLVGLDLFMALRGGGGVAAMAHLGGALFGYLYYRLGDWVYRYLERLEEKMIEEYKSQERERYRNLRKEVDRILDKISQEGISSLTRKEKEFLQKASKEYQKDSQL